MKYQKSSFPYLLLLFIILIGLPLADYRVESDLTIEYKITLTDNEKVQSKPIASPELITHTLHHSNNDF